MSFDKHKYIGLLGLLSIVGLKGFITGNYWWCIMFINYLWFTFFYENSPVYKIKRVN